MSESRPKKCSHCTEPTTLHVTKIVDGKVSKIGVCSSCPHKSALKSSVGFDLIDGGAASKPSPSASESSIACPHCGLTPADFKEYGRLGCSRCYDVFSEKLSPLFMKLHDHSEHLGKVPRGKRRVVSPEQIEALKRRLREHVSREEYELAASVRDQLKSLER